MPASATVVALSPAGRPDFYVLAADGVWSPAYEVAERVIDGVNRTTFYVHHTSAVVAVTSARMAQLVEADRVAVYTARGFEPMIAIVDDNEDAPAVDVSTDTSRVDAVGFARSARLREMMGPDGEISRWERMRRLLNVRCGQLLETTGEGHDGTRHAAAAFASNGRTRSSMALRTDDEMEMAVAWVEDRLLASDFDMEAADRAYAERQAQRAAGTYRQPARRAA